jgi:hypothetical protein
MESALYTLSTPYRKKDNGKWGDDNIHRVHGLVEIWLRISLCPGLPHIWQGTGGMGGLFRCWYAQIKSAMGLYR